MDSTRFSQPNPIERLFNRLFGLLAGWGIGLPHNYLGIRRLLLIWLFQQTTSSSIGACLVRRFRRRCVNFKRSSPARKPASSTWLPAAGRMASFVLDVDSGGHTNWCNGGGGSALVVGIRFRW